jgi:hypothetical protein
MGLKKAYDDINLDGNSILNGQRVESEESRFGSGDTWFQRNGVEDTLSDDVSGSNWTTELEMNMESKGYKYGFLVGSFRTETDYNIILQFNSGGNRYDYTEIDESGSIITSQNVESYAEFARGHSRNRGLRVPIISSTSETSFYNFSGQQEFNRMSVFWGSHNQGEPDTVRFRGDTTDGSNVTHFNISFVPYRVGPNVPWT